MASNPYVNKVGLANGTTLIDLSQDTATQADVAQGKYFHLPTGERVQGTASGGTGVGGITQDQNGYLVLDDDAPGGGGGGADCPTFTLTWDEYWEEILTVTCDKTFAECLDYFEDDPVKLVAHLEMTDELQSESAVFGMSGEQNAYGTEITYHAINAIGEAALDITIASNGAITWAEPTPSPTPSGGGLEYEEGTWTPSADIADTTISFSNSHTTPPILVMITESSSQSIGSADSNALLAICNPYTYLGYPIVNDSANRYGLAAYSYTTATAIPSSVSNLSSGNTLGTYLSTTNFRAYTGSTSRYWRTGRTYKWIAVWAPTT